MITGHELVPLVVNPALLKMLALQAINPVDVKMIVLLFSGWRATRLAVPRRDERLLDSAWRKCLGHK
jgi:hypothetical protein